MVEKSVGEKHMGDKSVAEKYIVEQFVGIKDIDHGRQEYGWRTVGKEKSVGQKPNHNLWSMGEKHLAEEKYIVEVCG